MVNKDVKIYKLSYSGMFEEQALDNPIDLFTLYTILAIYSKKSKRMYIWISKHANYTLKSYIPQIRELFAHEYPDLRILRNITVESGEEPFDFFKVFSFQKSELKERIRSQEEILSPLVDEINELKEEMEGLIKIGKYLEAAVISERIIELSREIKDRALEKDQEELLENLKEREKLKNLVQGIINEAEAVKELFDKFLEDEKYEEAHKLVEDFKKKNSKYQIDLASIPIIEELFLKDANIQQAAIVSTDNFLQLLSTFEKDFNKKLELKDVSGAEKALNKVKNLFKKIPKESIKNKWIQYEKNLNSYKKTLEEEQKKLLSKIKLLEDEINSNLEDENLSTVIKNCENILSISSGKGRDDIEEKYNTLLKNTKDKLITKKQEFKKSLSEISKLKGEKKYKDVIVHIDSLINQLSSSDFAEEKRELNNIKEDVSSKFDALEIFQKELVLLENNLNKSQDNYDLSQAILDCEEIILFTKNNNRSDLVEKYTLLKEDIELELKETKEIVETLVEELKNLRDDGKIEKAISKIDSMIEELQGPDYKEEKSRLQDLRKELSIEKEKSAQFRIDLSVLEQKLNESEDKHELSNSIDICQRIIQASKDQQREDLVEKYTSLIEELNHEIEETREVGDTLIGDIMNLKKDEKYDEAMSKIKSFEEELQDPCFKDLKDKLEKLKKEIGSVRSKKEQVI